MKAFRRVLGFILPCIVLGGLLFFGYYSLYIYKSSGQVACTGSAVARQTDIAVHVVRQWFGREGQMYAACPGNAN